MRARSHTSASGAAARAAFTLTELLVVVGIILLLVVIAIPIVQPALKDRKVREASRQLNGFIVGAQAMAASTGRGHGVWLERSQGDPARCIQVFRAEVAPPYSGDTLGSVVKRIVASGPGEYVVYFDAYASLLPSLVRIGDRIKFDFRQPLYEIISQPVATGGGDPPALVPGYKLTIRLRTISDAAPVGAGSPNVSLPYQVYRQPTKSIATSLELPAEMMIDLANSGMGPSGRELLLTNPASPRQIVIMFAPSGAVDEIYREQDDGSGNLIYGSQQPSGTIHLMVARADQGQLAPNFDPTDPASVTANLADVSSLWVSIGHRTGNVTSTENADISIPGPPPNPITKARQFAREKHAMGGR